MARPEDDFPGPHPEPPVDLHRRELPLREVEGNWYRVYRCDREPIVFGRWGWNRFDDPVGEYGVLYLGESQHCAFIETFGQLTGIRTVTTSELGSRCLAEVLNAGPLSLVDLTGAGLARLGADERLCSGSRDVARRWSRSLWSHPAGPDGILYRARHDPSLLSIAIFDRAARLLSAQPRGSWMAYEHRTVLGDVLDRYGIGLIDE